MCAAVLVVVEWGPSQFKLSAASVLVSAGVAILVWIARLREDYKLQRRRNTMEFLLSLRNNPTYEKHRDIVNEAIGFRDLSTEDAKLLRDARQQGGRDAKSYEKVAESLVYLLNLFEFACAAIVYGNYDEDFVYATIGPQIIGMRRRFASYIALAQNKNELTYLYLTAIADRWKAEPPGLRRVRIVRRGLRRPASRYAS